MHCEAERKSIATNCSSQCHECVLVRARDQAQTRQNRLRQRSTSRRQKTSERGCRKGRIVASASSGRRGGSSVDRSTTRRTTSRRLVGNAVRCRCPRASTSPAMAATARATRRPWRASSRVRSSLTRRAKRPALSAAATRLARRAVDFPDPALPGRGSRPRRRGRSSRAGSPRSAMRSAMMSAVSPRNLPRRQAHDEAGAEPRRLAVLVRRAEAVLGAGSCRGGPR